MKNIAIFASGNGTNADNICKYFSKSSKISVSLCVSNGLASKLENISKSHNIEYFHLEKNKYTNGYFLQNTLKEKKIDFIILAGYLKKIPKSVVLEFKDRVINIHPALLPKHGGKGMYGLNVHNAVLRAGDNISGITIHNVNNEYDTGKILFQKSCQVDLKETVLSLAKKIQKMEHAHYSKIIEKTILSTI